MAPSHKHVKYASGRNTYAQTDATGGMNLDNGDRSEGGHEKSCHWVTNFTSQVCHERSKFWLNFSTIKKQSLVSPFLYFRPCDSRIGNSKQTENRAPVRPFVSP